MRLSVATIVGSLLMVSAWSQATPDATPDITPDVAMVVGTWEGESKCAVPDSPCHDEHALYRITPGKAVDKAINNNDPQQLVLDAYKVVNDRLYFIGTLACQYRLEAATLSCSGNTRREDMWEFHVATDKMAGTLTIGAEKQLFRRITLTKTQPKPK